MNRDAPADAETDLLEFLGQNAAGKSNVAAWRRWPTEAVEDLARMHAIHVDPRSDHYGRVNQTIVLKRLKSKHGVEATRNQINVWVRANVESGRWDP